ncbi:hypothetical protein O7599_17675 [Streptomyces sp. WMMC500]|uniref:hypothetical protein n=1 Tax=Streptomyces sp. WMMC500 TaxID=3015154 RepID=UPI00248C1FCD|nr:hypothetical protein [Streptomyces sp. WMMC500]WBB64225.1 hypothetical protein O7599_17675 [Streptomyces sp. WMMC500]
MLSDGPGPGPGDPDGGARSGGPYRDERHRTSTAERGAFVCARCTCGWTGPARRARSRARADAADHLPDLPDGTG